MKNIFLKGILAALPLFMAACSPNSLFDDTPKDKISDEKTWENAMLLDEYVNTWYRNMNSGFKTYVPSTVQEHFALLSALVWRPADQRKERLV